MAVGFYQYPMLRELCRQKVAGFIKYENRRSANYTPSLGEIIALLSVVNVSWPSASSAIASEVTAEGQSKAGWLS